MPQFDKITFFGQIFWLTVIFFSFYFISLELFLPKISAVLKTRKKKLSIGLGSVKGLNEEQFSIENKKNNCSNNMSEHVYARLEKNISDTSLVLLYFIKELKNQKLQSSQLNYLKNFGAYNSSQEKSN
jgi:hypothetical protein